MELDKLLETLKGAGLTVPSDAEGLGGFGEELKGLLEKAGSASTLESELEKARGEAEKAQKEATENFERMRKKDTSLSAQDLKIKELEKQLAERGMTNASTDSATMSALEALRGQVGEMANMLKAEQEKTTQLAKEVKRRELIESLAKEVPALAQNPGLQALIPNTDDPDTIENVKGLLQTFVKSTEETAYDKVRSGYVPSTAPPRVSPDKPEQLQGELDRIRELERTHQLTPQEARDKIMHLAQLMEPK